MSDLPSVYDTPMIPDWGAPPDRPAGPDVTTQAPPASIPSDPSTGGNAAPAPALGEGLLSPALSWLVTGIAENWKRLAMHGLAVFLALVLIGVGIVGVVMSNRTVQNVAQTAAAVAA